MTMGEECNVAFQCPQLGDNPVSATGNLRRTFTLRTAIAKNIPALSLLENVD